MLRKTRKLSGGRLGKRKKVTKRRRKSLLKKKRTKKRRKSLFKKKRTKKRRKKHRRTSSGNGDEEKEEDKQPPERLRPLRFGHLRGRPGQNQEQYDELIRERELRELDNAIKNNPLNEIDGGYRRTKRRRRSKRGGCGDC